MTTELPDGLPEFLTTINLYPKGQDMDANVKDHTPEELALLDPVDQAIYWINEPWEKQVLPAIHEHVLPGMLETGRRLLEKKGDQTIPHGQFQNMIQHKLRFSYDTARRLMAVARNPVLVKAEHAPVLPLSWYVLSILATMDPETLEAKIKNGEINERTERTAALALAKAYPGEKRRSGNYERQSRTKKTKEEQRLSKELEATKSHVEDLENARDIPPPQANGHNREDNVEQESELESFDPDQEELQRLQAEDNEAISALRSAANKLVYAEKSKNKEFIREAKKHKEDTVERRKETQRALKRKKEDLGIEPENRRGKGERIASLPGVFGSLDITSVADGIMWAAMSLHDNVLGIRKSSETAKKVLEKHSLSDESKKNLIETITEQALPRLNQMIADVSVLQEIYNDLIARIKGEIRNPVTKAQVRNQKPSHLALVPSNGVGN